MASIRLATGLPPSVPPCRFFFSVFFMDERFPFSFDNPSAAPLGSSFCTPPFPLPITPSFRSFQLRRNSLPPILCCLRFPPCPPAGPASRVLPVYVPGQRFPIPKRPPQQKFLQKYPLFLRHLERDTSRDPRNPTILV